MIAQTRKPETALPEGLTKQLKAALLILEAVDEAYSNDLSFNSACDLTTAMERVKYILGESQPQYVTYTPEQRQEVIRKAELLMQEAA
jgi:hypothetical protein